MAVAYGHDLTPSNETDRGVSIVVDRSYGEEFRDGEKALHGGADHRHAA